MNNIRFLTITSALISGMFLQAEWSFYKIEDREQLENMLEDYITCKTFLANPEKNNCLKCLQELRHHIEEVNEKPVSEYLPLNNAVLFAEKLWHATLQDSLCADAYKSAQKENTVVAWNEFQKTCARTAASILHNTTSLEFPSLKGRDYTGLPSHIRATEFLNANAEMNLDDCTAYQGGMLFLYYLKQLSKVSLSKGE